MEDRDREKDGAKPVGVPDEHRKKRKNITQGCLYREMGKYKNKIPPEFLLTAEDKLVNKATYEEMKCQLPGSPRSTFLMVFSPDGKKVASTHGNHNVYVTDLTTGKNIRTLSGHPRTPWCIAFHPSSNQILASGCLAGQVRVWDLHGGSEVWTTESQSVIASLAFHPVDRMLVIATYNELHFWDWSQPKPFAKCSTKNEKEKVRYVSFDPLGHKLITGIANPVNGPIQWNRVGVVSTQSTVTTSSTTSTTAPSTTTAATSSTRQSLGRPIAFCDNFVMNQYNELLRNYIEMTRPRVTRTVIDRGTDPMDFVDVPILGGLSDLSRRNAMFTSQADNRIRSVRYRIVRSTCRTYLGSSSREHIQIHSSLLSELPAQSLSSLNTLAETTTTTTTSQSIIFTTTTASSSSSSMPQRYSRLRQFGFGFIARPVCLTFSRDNSSTSISVRASHPMPMSSSHSGAVTNLAFSPFSDRSVFSTRETNSTETEREWSPIVEPYQIFFDDIDHIRASIRTLVRSANEQNGNRNNSEFRPNIISPLDRRDRQRSHLLDVEEMEIDRDFSRSFAYVSPFRRLSSDSESTSTTPTNNQRPSPQHWVSFNTNHLPLYPRPVPRFQVRPIFDLNNTSPVRRYRDNTDFEMSANTTPTMDVPSSVPTSSSSLSPVQLNAGPFPRLQIRPRYLQDQSQLATSSESQSSGLQSNHILRRQFVLSRHSNSPFQPRVPHVVENSGLATTSSSSTSCRPEIPSCMSSFVASGTSSGSRSAAATSLPVGNAGSSTSNAINTATTTVAGDESFVRGNGDPRNRLHFFDHVDLLLRDRIRNSSEHASTDSTINYSNIADESEGETRSTIDSPLEDGNTSSALGPRGLDPMLSSGSRNSDNTNELPFFQSTGSASRGNSSTEPTLPLSHVPWDSDGDTIQYPSSPLGSFASDTAASTQPDPSSEGTSQDQQNEKNPHKENSNEENSNDENSNEENPNDENSNEENPNDENSNEENPNDENSNDENSNEENPNDENSNEENPNDENSNEENPNEENPNDENSNEENPNDENPNDENPNDENSNEENPNDENPNDENPNDENPNDENSNDENPNEENPNDENPNDENPNDENPNDENPNDENPNEENAYGEDAYEEDAFEEDAYEEDAYEEHEYGEDAYEESPSEDSLFDESLYGDSPYGDSPYEDSPFEESPFEESPFEDSPYEANAYEANAYEQNAYEQNAYEENPNEESPNEESSNEESPNEENPNQDNVYDSEREDEEYINPFYVGNTSGSDTSSNGRDSPIERNFRQKITALSLDHKMVKKVLRVKVECKKLRRMRKNWQELMAQFRSINSSTSSNRNSTQLTSESESRDRVNMLAIGDNSPIPGTSSAQSSFPLPSTSQFFNPQPSTSRFFSPQPSTSRFFSPQPSTSRFFSPQPSTSQSFNPQPSTSQFFNPQPSTSRFFSPQPSTSQSFNPQPSTSQFFNPQPSTSQSFNPQPSTSRSFNPQPSTSQSFNPQPSTSRSFNPQPSTSQFFNPQPSTSWSFSPQPSTSRFFNPQPSTSQSFNPQPSTSQSFNPQPSTSQSFNPQPSTSRFFSPQPSTSQSFNPQPSTSRSFNPQPSTSQSFNPQPSTSRSFNPQPSTSQFFNPQPSTSWSFNPQPSTSRFFSSQPSTSQSFNPQPSTSRSFNPQPSTSQSFNPQPSTSQSFNPQPSTSRSFNPQPSTSRSFNPQPSTSRSCSPKPSTSRSCSPQPSTSRSTNTRSSHENFCNRFKSIIESTVDTSLDDNGQNSSSRPFRSRRRRRRRRRRRSGRRRIVTEEPQPGPSGLNRSSLPDKDYFKRRIYKSIEELLNKTNENGAAVMDTQHLCQRHAARLRTRRDSRQSQDSSHPGATSSFSSNLPSTSSDLERSVNSPTPQPSTSKAYQSCGEKKKSGKELLKQKRKLEDSAPESESGVSSSKIMKSNVGGRSATSTVTTAASTITTAASTITTAASTITTAASTITTAASIITTAASTITTAASTITAAASTITTVASTSTSLATTNDNATPSTSSGLPGTDLGRELLRKIMQRMEAMVRFQCQVFRQAEALLRSSRSRRTSSSDSSSDDSDTDDDLVYRTLRMKGLPRNYNITRRDVMHMNRAIVQLRTRRLLDYMIESLTEFFEENPETSDTMLDEQIIRLYTLLHLCLELANLILEQLNVASRNLETVVNLYNATREIESRNEEVSFSERSGTSRSVREQSGSETRSSDYPSFGPSREEARRIFQNQAPRTFWRARYCANHSPFRFLGGHFSNSNNGSYRPTSASFIPLSTGYRRYRRLLPRSPGSTTRGRRGSNNSPRRLSHPSRSREGQPNVISQGRIRNGDNNQSQVRGVRILERRNSVDGESNFHRRFRSDNNNNNNSNLVQRGSNGNGNLDGISISNNDNSSNGNGSGSSENHHNTNSLSFSAYLNLREQRPMFWIRYGTNSENNSSSRNESQSRENNFTVPVVHVNDIPVQDVSVLSQPRYRPQSPTPRGADDFWRWRTWRPRFLHPRYAGHHNYDDQDVNDAPESVHYYRTNSNSGIYSLDPVIITDAPMSPHHRIQAWDFSKMKIPDISDREVNGVVAECKIHNDASVDISNDGHLLVTLLPSGRFSVTTMLGVYSLDWNSLGQLLYKTSFEQNAVSVSLSPTNRHLLVGLASRPLVLRDRINMAQIFRLEGARPSPPGDTWESGRGRLVHVRDLEQTRETNVMSLNCIRWAPGAGQGLVYGTNTGQLKVLR